MADFAANANGGAVIRTYTVLIRMLEFYPGNPYENSGTSIGERRRPILRIS